MLRVSTILCPVDRSPVAARALAYAVALAREWDARVHVIEVLEFTSVPLPSGAYPIELSTAVRDEALASLQAFAAPAVRSGLVDDVRLREGRVSHQIQQHVEESGADLIVMGTHGRSGFERLTLGSVTERVLQRGTVPVLVVPPGDEHPAERPFRTVLCPTDFSPAGNEAVDAARQVATRCGASSLVLVHVVEWPFGHTQGPDAITTLRLSLEAEARDQLDELAAGDPATHLTVTSVVAAGKPSREILNLARTRLADLVVMGLSGRGAIDIALLGSTTHQVVRHAPCPVLTVPRSTA